MMLGSAALRLGRGIADLKVATNHISDRKNIAQENARWLGWERPCLLTLSVADTRPRGRKCHRTSKAASGVPRGDHEIPRFQTYSPRRTDYLTSQIKEIGC
jgi:hypothetical protein